MYKATGRERERAQGETPGERRDKVRDRDRKTANSESGKRVGWGCLLLLVLLLLVSVLLVLLLLLGLCVLLLLLLLGRHLLGDLSRERAVVRGELDGQVVNLLLRQRLAASVEPGCRERQGMYVSAKSLGRE